MFRREPNYTIRDAQGKLIEVELRRDRRLKKSSRWERLPDGRLLLRIPLRYPRQHISALLAHISTQLDKALATRQHRSDADLQQRAEFLNHKYFQGAISWSAIRWVSNMQSRLGSCTRGGATDGEIRISERIKAWPEWVIDYVIAHELMHRKHPNHSAAFWSELQASYPLAEKARGFIAGVGFAGGQWGEEE